MGLRILVPKPRLQLSALRANKLVWAALGFALWGAAYTLFGASGLAGVMRARADIEDLEQRVEEAAARNRALQQQIDRVKEDPDTIERLAREQFYLAKPDETVYLLPPPPAHSTVGPGGSTTETESSFEVPRLP